jgi:hypothetical protein
VALGVPEIVNTPLLNDPLVPAGRLPAVMLAPVAPPPIKYATSEIGSDTQTDWLLVPNPDAKEML